MQPITTTANPGAQPGELQGPATIDARFAFIPRLHSWDDLSLLCQPAFVDGQVRAARCLSRVHTCETAANDGSRSALRATKH